MRYFPQRQHLLTSHEPCLSRFWNVLVLQSGNYLLICLFLFYVLWFSGRGHFSIYNTWWWSSFSMRKLGAYCWDGIDFDMSYYIFSKHCRPMAVPFWIGRKKKANETTKQETLTNFNDQGFHWAPSRLRRRNYPPKCFLLRLLNVLNIIILPDALSPRITGVVI